MSISKLRARLNELPAYHRTLATIDATHFNLVRLALLRLEQPLRIALPHLRGLDFLIEPDAWVCVDRTLNDVPVVAWVDFVSAGRASLVAPIDCQLWSYHSHGEMIVDAILADVTAFLTSRVHGNE